MENRLAQSSVNHPLAISITASALILLVVTGSLLTQPWQKCASANQNNAECLQSEFFMMLTPAPLQAAPPQLVITSPVSSTASPIKEQNPQVNTEQTSPTALIISAHLEEHIPQFPDFILPRPETAESISVIQEASKERKIPDFVIFQMTAMSSQKTLPSLPRTASMHPQRRVQLGEPQTQPFFFNKIVIQDGDNLWSIASRIYGAGRQYIKIFEVNKDLISSPHRIFPGQVLALPNDIIVSNSVTE